MIGLADEPPEPRRIGGLLMIGLLCAPLIFGWLLLRRGYSNSTRAVVGVYALLGPALVLLTSLDRSGG